MTFLWTLNILTRTVCVVYTTLKDSSLLKMEFNRENFLINNAWRNLIQFLAMMLHQGLVLNDDMMNSIVIVVHFQTNFVKVKISCCVEYHWCCALTDITRSSYDIPWGWHNLSNCSDQQTLNIASKFVSRKNLFVLDPTLFAKNSKKASFD